jgi:hypothetical protein
MKLTIPAYDRIRKGINPSFARDTDLMDGSNIVFDRGKTYKRWGYAELGDNLPLNGRISLISYYKKLRTTDHEVIVCTDKDIYKYYDGSWIFITPIYNIGTASASGTAVTGGGTTWDYSNWPATQYYIKFGTDDPNGVGTPDTWYEVASFDSATTLTLSDDAGTIGAGDYVIRRVFALTATEDWQVSYVIEPAGGSDELWAVLSNGTEIWHYTGTGQVSDLAGTDLGAKFITSYYDHILAANVIDSGVSLPQSIYWNNRGDPEDWAGGSAGYEDLIQGTGVIMGMEILNQRIYIVKPYSMIEGYYTTEVSPAFTFNQDKIYKSGCANSKTLVNTGSFLIFMGVEHVTLFDGFQINYIDDDVSKDLITSLNQEFAYKNFAAHIADKFLYCLFIVDINHEEPNKVYVYNYRTKTWTIWDIADFMRCTGEYTVETEVAWEDIPDGVAWTDYGGYWNISTLTANSNRLAFGDSAGYVYSMDFTNTTDNETDIDCFIETKDYESIDKDGRPKTDVAMKLLRTLLTMESYLGDVRVRYSIDFGSTWSDPVTFTQDDSMYFFQRWLGRGNQVRFRIENIDNSQFELINMMIEYNESGRIN